MEVITITKTIVNAVNGVLSDSFVVSLWVSNEKCRTKKRSKLNVLGRKYPFIRPLGGYLIPSWEIEDIGNMLKSIDYGDCRIKVFVRKVQVSDRIDEDGEQAALIARELKKYIENSVKRKLVPRIRDLIEKQSFRGVHKVKKAIETWLRRLAFYAGIDPVEREKFLEALDALEREGWTVEGLNTALEILLNSNKKNVFKQVSNTKK